MTANAQFDAGSISIFWKNKDPALAGAMLSMEKAEDWVHDAEVDIREALSGICEKIESLSGSGLPLGKGVDDNLIRISGYIKSGRAMMLLDWIDKTIPGYGGRVVAKAQASNLTDDTAALLLDRLQFLERIHLLSRVFHPESLRDVLEVLEAMNADH